MITKQTYIIRSTASEFHIWKTYNIEQDEKERARDIKNNYPICVPRPAKSEGARMDAIGEQGYFLGMKNIKGEILGLVIVSSNRIMRIFNVKDGKVTNEFIF